MRAVNAYTLIESRPHPDLLNDIGCVLARHTPQTLNISERLRTTTVMQWAMFSGAAHLGCETSALSMTRWIALASFEDKDIVKRPLFRSTMDLHRKMLEQGKPMSLYIEGELLLRTGKIDAAIRILDRAHSESNSSVIWWPEVCNALGIAHSMKDQPEIALEYWKEAAREGSVEALKGIFHTTNDAELRDDAMYKLACKGNTEVLGTIAMVENAKITDEEEMPTPQDQAFQGNWAREWSKMAEYDMQARRSLQHNGHDGSADEGNIPISEETLLEIRNALTAEKKKQMEREQ